MLGFSRFRAEGLGLRGGAGRGGGEGGGWGLRAWDEGLQVGVRAFRGLRFRALKACKLGLLWQV